MSLTLLKGIMPHVPAVLPMVISDPELRSRAEETFMSPDFQENIEEYFVQNIKVSLNMCVLCERMCVLEGEKERERGEG